MTFKLKRTTFFQPEKPDPDSGDAMRRSKQETEETRRHIVETAAAEFRGNGIDGTGLIGLMSAAGLTHGGFYKHFDSKDQLVAEALELAAGEMVAAAKHIASITPGQRGLQAIVTEYLSSAHRDDSAHGCVFSALGCEIARGNDAIREPMTSAFLEVVDNLAGQLDTMPRAAARKEATWMFCAMVGAITMARMVNNPEVSSSILRETRKHLTHPR
ncbi:TetR/AcrR family transcriptional regulator [Silvibacterium acidisoli]|uniref:TetR/AcrR family transcriptional regulator n=1 Tax=Acidobacteriaceae bacterium ZG23-2 TaxID=2883246 RepID=UPI00406CEEEC